MAEIVLGIGTSHSPLLAIDAAMWAERAQDDLHKTELHLRDGRVITYNELLTESGGRYAAEARPGNFEKQAQQAQESLDRLAAAVTEADLDALIVIGDDQEELFSKAHMPAIAVFNGPEVVTHPKNEVNSNLPGWYRQANHGYLMDAVHTYPVRQDVADAVIGGLIEQGVDVAVASEVLDPHRAGFGHAYGFVIDRLVRDVAVPLVPVMLNTYFPPNVPRPSRCYDIGLQIKRAVEAMPAQLRVGVVASGGLTHFVVDEGLDRAIVDGLRDKDEQALRTVPHYSLTSGNSEILNWIMTGAAVNHLTLVQDDYIPVRRTPAGTGIGLAFLIWR
ncbi:DODA-type extradiol aromatic ring-opening family dioxygenase [Nocardia sp. R6R-6]|uniref:DODA-type extradiol aromatic ring-opening family dioxygenase n=1 Tax=Nocardia sp. R6R-6 TaxID=3459303 RepID=UPI00403E3143